MTIKEFVETHCSGESEKRLFRAVMKQIGDWKGVFQNPEDYRNAKEGVNGFCYGAQTVPFAKKNIVDILNVLNEYEHELGKPLNTKPCDADESSLFNWYAWFALEHCVQLIIDYNEINS